MPLASLFASGSERKRNIAAVPTSGPSASIANAQPQPDESLTIGNARAFGLDEEIGSVETGKRADLLILTSNPLDDVAAYDTITRVILNGELITRESLSARKQEREN